MRNQARTMAIAFALSAAMAALAQGAGEIQGKVHDADGPVPGAVVTAEQGENRVSAMTDLDGHFVLKPLPAGTYTVHVQMTSMQGQEISGVLVATDNISFLKDIQLRAAELGAVIIEKLRWEPPLIDPDNPGVTKVFHTQFKNSPLAKNPVALIAAYSPGVIKAANGDGLYFRGARSENMCYIVDGMKLGDRLSGVPNEAINSFSVYTGGLPAKYGDVTGGVVAIETKSYFDLYQQRNAGIQ